MDRFEDLLRKVVTTLNAANTNYMFTNAIAVSYYGSPRTTMDADIIVDVSEKNVRDHLITPLKQVDIIIDEKKILDMLNSDYRILALKDKKSPFTLDIIFSEEEIAKRPGKLLGLPTYYQIPEELVLSKLRMIKATISEKRAFQDKEDIKTILQYTKVDEGMLRTKADEQSTFSILKPLLDRLSH